MHIQCILCIKSTRLCSSVVLRHVAHPAIFEVGILLIHGKHVHDLIIIVGLPLKQNQNVAMLILVYTEI